MVMILLGLLPIFFCADPAPAGHKTAAQYGVAIPRSISYVLAILVLLFGIALLLGTIFRQ